MVYMLKAYKAVVSQFPQLSPESVAILYGSVASGKARQDSDIDIALISSNKADAKKADAFADKVGLEYGKVISIAKFTPQQFRLPTNARFAREVMKGEVLHGTRSRLERDG